MKRIGIDARLLHQTGVGTYLQNLLYHLAKQPEKRLQYVIYTQPQDSEKVRALSPHFIVRSSPYRWHSVSEQILFLIQLIMDRLDLMHFTYFGHPILYLRPFITTIHDITPLLFATGKSSTRSRVVYGIKYLFFRLVLWNQVMRSKHIIVPTKTVSEQLAALYGEKIASKISVLYEGVGYVLSAAQKHDHSRLGISGPYFLYVGNFYPHKNVERLIAAFHDSQTKLHLICAGPHDFFQRRLARVTKHDHVFFLSSLRLDDLIYLYMHAEALIHPSLSEGFGLPIVEALFFHLPVIASDIPVFRELLGDAYYAFNPYDIVSIRKTITRFENDKVKRVAPLKELFSFEKMAYATRDLYLRYV